MRLEPIYREIGKDPLYRIWHASSEHMLIWFCSDGGSIVFRDAVYEIRAGMLCFVASGCYHYTMPEVPECYERSKLFFSESFFEKTAVFTGTEDVVNLFCSRDMICAQIPQNLWQEVDGLFRPEASPLIAMGNLMKLLGLLERYADEGRMELAGFMAEAVRYINIHIRDNITVDQICGAIHMSKYYFCRRFKEQTGLTVMEYILQTRISLAKDMLLKTDSPVGQVSENCGFSSEAYFCRVFKKITERTPRQYRRQGGGRDIKQGAAEAAP